MGSPLGYCLMIGGAAAAFQHCERIFKTLAAPDGYAHVGPSGAGHYVKMVHNGIEYGLLQAYARATRSCTPLGISSYSWQDREPVEHGSVVRSWLNELAERSVIARRPNSTPFTAT